MTLTQLRYVLAVAEEGSFSEAARKVFISQPSLTVSIKELEQELGIVIFTRTNKGVRISSEGDSFLGYARQVVEQVSLLEERYHGKRSGKQSFSVSSQHFSFAVEAFVDLVKKFGQNRYDFTIRETQTYEILEDVAKLRSEVGLLYLNRYNEAVLSKALSQHSLEFHSLCIARPHVFIGTDNPLAGWDSVHLSDLADFPYLSFEQGEHNSFFFSEELLSEIERRKNIRVRDRATLFNLLRGINGYTISSGMISSALNGDDILSIPLDVDDYMDIGYIVHKRIDPGALGRFYIDSLHIHIERYRALGIVKDYS